MGCKRCLNPTAIVKSRDRKECHEHWEQDKSINKSSKSKQWLPIDHLLNNSGKIKTITSLRQKKTYKKVTQILEDGDDRNSYFNCARDRFSYR